MNLASGPNPAFTTKVQGFSDCLDYIFAHGFQIANTLSAVSEADLAPYRHIPNEAYGSDHISIAVDLIPIETVANDRKLHG